MTEDQRKQALKVIWRTTHKDFKDKTFAGEKTIMVYRKGTCIVLLNDLTDEEIMDCLRKADRVAIFGEC